MVIFDMENGARLDDYKLMDTGNRYYFIMADPTDDDVVSEVFAFHQNEIEEKTNIQKTIRYQIYENYDFVSILYASLKGRVFEHSKINMYLGEHVLLMFTKSQQWAYELMMDDIEQSNALDIDGKRRLAHMYYRVFDHVLNDLFKDLSDFENMLMDRETNLMKKAENDDFDTLVTLRRTANEVKRNTRMLLYLTDEILANESEMLPEIDLNLFKNIDNRVDKLFQFSSSIQEMTEHLLSIYDSRIASQTNDFINKFTVISMFLTPLSVLTGVFGMNFLEFDTVKIGFAEFIFVGVTVAVLILNFVFMKKNKWL